ALSCAGAGPRRQVGRLLQQVAGQGDALVGDAEVLGEGLDVNESFRRLVPLFPRTFVPVPRVAVHQPLPGGGGASAGLRRGNGARRIFGRSGRLIWRARPVRGRMAATYVGPRPLARAAARQGAHPDQERARALTFLHKWKITVKSNS